MGGAWADRYENGEFFYTEDGRIQFYEQPNHWRLENYRDTKFKIVSDWDMCLNCHDFSLNLFFNNDEELFSQIRSLNLGNKVFKSLINGIIENQHDIEYLCEALAIIHPLIEKYNYYEIRRVFIVTLYLHDRLTDNPRDYYLITRTDDCKGFKVTDDTEYPGDFN